MAGAAEGHSKDTAFLGRTPRPGKGIEIPRTVMWIQVYCFTPGLHSLGPNPFSLELGFCLKTQRVLAYFPNPSRHLSAKVVTVSGPDETHGFLR